MVAFTTGRVAQKGWRGGSHSPERWLNSFRSIQQIYKPEHPCFVRYEKLGLLLGSQLQGPTNDRSERYGSPQSGSVRFRLLRYITWTIKLFSLHRSYKNRLLHNSNELQEAYLITPR